MDRLRLVTLLVIGLVLTYSCTVAAFTAKGDVWLLGSETTLADEKVERIFGAELDFLTLGPLRLGSELQFGGDPQRLQDFYQLLRDDLAYDDQELAEMVGDAWYAVGDFHSRVTLNWPLLPGVSVHGLVGYRITGAIYKPAAAVIGDDLTSYLYQGLTYGGGVGVSPVLGLRVHTLYEIGPSLSVMHGTGEDADWVRWQLGAEYKMPILLGQIGYRYQKLATSSETLSKFSGLYVGAGIHF